MLQLLKFHDALQKLLNCLFLFAIHIFSVADYHIDINLIVAIYLMILVAPKAVVDQELLIVKVIT